MKNLSYTINSIVTDDLVIQAARSSAAMTLAGFA